MKLWQAYKDQDYSTTTRIQVPLGTVDDTENFIPVFIIYHMQGQQHMVLTEWKALNENFAYTVTADTKLTSLT